MHASPLLLGVHWKARDATFTAILSDFGYLISWVRRNQLRRMGIDRQPFDITR
jgi:hypothetical protein